MPCRALLSCLLIPLCWGPAPFFLFEHTSTNMTTQLVVQGPVFTWRNSATELVGKCSGIFLVSASTLPMTKIQSALEKMWWGPRLIWHPLPLGYLLIHSMAIKSQLSLLHNDTLFFFFFYSGVCNSGREIQSSFITYPFNIASLSHVQLCTFTVVVIRGAIGCFRANSIILARTWHTRST